MKQPHNWKSSLLLSIPLFVLAACSTNKYAATNKIYKEQANVFGNTLKEMPPLTQTAEMVAPDQQFFIGSVNFGIRKPNFVIIHHTAQTSTDQTIKTFTLKSTGTSAHYVIGRDGKVVHMVNDYLRANHAGVAKWGNETDLNSCSLGIELDNNGDEPYSDAQINSLIAVLTTLKKKYNIPAQGFIGHSDIAPKRKIDPNKFPWKKLAEQGFGLWYDDVLQIPPAEFDPAIALRIIGYDISNMPAAIIAFKRHFVQTDITPVLTQSDTMILFNLYRKYM
ncbi:N-acetylmuramoyl-L-alanine amidase [Pedobacter westerhofensis]|uniref:N-acetylmuramoyl-L-alanine amidase n=1 Tax=Pedobacter westerhofensis TaxID=425512 RepID=A0A521DWT2_9SPHI|nr:N-acetylmuramoyl-L-alanine amidase [Pedobacter westerhofensis]SMO76146.1 N-acetylmuramoyl-L-alanine amidase [Pedobacter westerhofensis]